ncbi:MAG: carbon storage regulator [Planctomycetaceae bacterium]|nr:carbon storage regulator [Planctomycetaceae bacterium]
MLVLTRRVSETVRIGDDVTVTIVRTGRNSVQIGIDAPRSVKISRGELDALPNSPPASPAIVRTPPRERRTDGSYSLQCLGAIS